MIKLVAFDLDGTVVDHENKPTPSTLKTIRKLIDAGIHVASISGRSISKSQSPFVEHTDFAETLSVGSYNGAVALDRVRDGGRHALHEQRMPAATFREIVDDLDQTGINYIYCHLRLGGRGVEVEDYVTLRRDKTIDDMTVQTGTQFVIEPDLTAKIASEDFGAPPKILICPGEASREKVYEDLKAKYDSRLYIERTDVDRVEAMHPDVNKGKALAAICGACGVEVSEAMAIGDGSNDLPMLESAGVGVLLGNADDRTKAAANEVESAASFYDNGFTEAVERFVPGL
jgi:Cof subfamily protein (haloacid dehalogenase superfamily)